MIRLFLVVLLPITLAGCSPVTDHWHWPEPVHPAGSDLLYRFRIEHSGTTRFVGLLALEPKAAGMRTVLLDASGLPLIKGLVAPGGTMRADYKVTTGNAEKLPRLLGRIIDYIYLIPASSDCPWYDLFRVCSRTVNDKKSEKWRKAGPFRLWQVDRLIDPDGQETITVNLNMQSVRVTLQYLAEEPGT